MAGDKEPVPQKEILVRAIKKIGLGVNDCPTYAEISAELRDHLRDCPSCVDVLVAANAAISQLEAGGHL